MSGFAYNLLGFAWPNAQAVFHHELDSPWAEAFQDAASSWNQLTPFTFTVVENSAKDPCENPSVQDPKNGLTFSDTICGAAYGPTALAVTSTWTTEGGRTALQSGIWYNTAFSWSVYSGPTEQGVNGVYDFRRVSMHELGHSLGLWHEELVPSIMREVVSDLEDPTTDDIAGVEEIYLSPRVTSVSPDPVAGLDAAQPFEITGTAFSSNPNVILRDLGTNEVFPNRVVSTATATRLVINPNFTSNASPWSVEVVNSDGRSSGEFGFQVLDPSVVGPDLVVEEISMDPIQAEPGTIATARVLIRNQGNADSAPQTTNIRLSDSSVNVTPSDILLSTSPLNVIQPPGSLLTLDVPFLVPETLTGNAFVWAIIDVTNSAGQIDTTNDTANTPFRVLGGAPDLVVDSLAVVPTSGARGELINVNFSIRNRGSSTALPSIAGLRLSTSNNDVTSNDPSLATVTVDAIPAGGSVNISQPVVVPQVPVGQQFIWVIADGDNTAGQLDLSNDRSFTPFSIVTDGNPDVSLRWPVPGFESNQPTQDYADFDDGSTNRHHSGIDIGAPFGSDVVAAAAGTVRVLRLSEQNNRTRCFGNVVLIDHGSVATLYAHLRDGSIPVEDGPVSAGAKIGEVGNTTGLLQGGGSCTTQPIGAHLHFEVKQNAVLGTTADDALQTWGYTPPLGQSGGEVSSDQPDNFGYFDPLLYLEPAIASSSASRVQVTADGAGVALRMGPSTNYRSLGGMLSAGAEYVVRRELPGPTANCAAGWYQLEQLTGAYFPDASGGRIPDAWACRGTGGETWLQPDAQPEACAGTTLSGVVRNELTGLPAVGATVSLSGAGSVTTDGNGAYNFGPVTQGVRLLEVDVPGLRAFDQSLELCGPATQDIQLVNEGISFGVNVDTIFGDPVNTATGNYVYQARDLQLPGIGMPFRFERSYNSRDDREGPLGFNWTHNWHLALTEGSSYVRVRWGGGQTQTWTEDGAGGYTAQFGVFDRLTKLADGVFEVRKKNQMRYRFEGGRLTQVTDRNGNKMALSYSGDLLTQVVDTVGRQITLSYDAADRLIRITDPLGREIVYAYDANGDLVTATNAGGNTTTYTYDDRHQILSVTDPRGNALVTNTYDASDRVVTFQTDAKAGGTTYSYDPERRATTVTDALGYNTVHRYDELLRLVESIDTNNARRLFEFDDAGNRVAVTDEAGDITRYGYDVRGNVTNKTDALGQVTSITYDANDNPLQRTDALGGTTMFVYDGSSNLIQTTDALGFTTTLTYLPSGLPATVTDARGFTTSSTYDNQGNLMMITDALDGVTQFGYDAVGRRLSVTDANNHTTEFTYDANDNLLTITDALDRTLSYSYDNNDNRTSVTNRRGFTTTYTYDEKDLLVQSADALDQVAQTSYDLLNRRRSATDENGNVTEFTVDPMGRVVAVEDALDQISRLAYDATGNLVRATDPRNQTTSYTYDALDRPVSVSDPLGNTATTTYDALGRVTERTNAKGQITKLTYDALGRLTRVKDANGGLVRYAYDGNGNRTQMIDPNGQRTIYVYDALNRLVQKVEPLGSTTRYDYDPVGNLTQLTKPNGVVVTYGYDAIDQLVSIAYPNDAPVSFTYDANGNRTQMLDGLGTQTFVYDALDRLTSHTDPFGNTVAYGYDAVSNRTALTYPDGNAVNYGYDALNRLSTVTDWLTNVTQYSYDAGNRLVSQVSGNGTQALYEYDDANRMLSLRNERSDGSVISSDGYVLDALGNHLEENAQIPVAPTLPTANTTYSYDEENRLVAVNGAVITFDVNGNLTARGGTSYRYDDEDRLIERITPSGTISYLYDGVGRRYGRIEGGTTERYVMDLNTTLPSVIANANGSNTIQGHNVYGLGLTHRISGTNVSYHHYDYRGSTTAVTDEAGATTSTTRYDPYGGVLAGGFNEYGYMGRFGVQSEDETLAFVRARFYDAELQRFLNKDRYLGESDRTQSLNRYGYALGNPVMKVDPSGFAAQKAPDVNALRGVTSSDDDNHFLLEGQSANHPTTILETSARSLGEESLYDPLGRIVCDANGLANSFYACQAAYREETKGLVVFLTVIREGAGLVIGSVADCTGIPAAEALSFSYGATTLLIDQSAGFSQPINNAEYAKAVGKKGLLDFGKSTFAHLYGRTEGRASKALECLGSVQANYVEAGYEVNAAIEDR